CYQCLHCMCLRDTHREPVLFPPRRSSGLPALTAGLDQAIARGRAQQLEQDQAAQAAAAQAEASAREAAEQRARAQQLRQEADRRSEEHTSELQSRENLVCRTHLDKIKMPY